MRVRIEQVKGLSRELLPWATLMGLGYLVINGELAGEVQKALTLWGPGILLVLMAWIAAKDYLPPFIESQKAQAVALQKLADAVEQQNVGYERTLEKILHGNQVILDRFDRLKEHIDGTRHAG